eukprot:TRINITY_DN29150_c0_g3_i1.p1 TRINITY_DN29150_c0_g3~~TRINITY_DN29150_c0_g3_i1.p1  ORF type:complete len:484 (-),score=107.78 TRINITY_DN29150_c0_g3_i1:10-1398(-)
MELSSAFVAAGLRILPASDLSVASASSGRGSPPQRLGAGAASAPALAPTAATLALPGVPSLVTAFVAGLAASAAATGRRRRLRRTVPGAALQRRSRDLCSAAVATSVAPATSSASLRSEAQQMLSETQAYFVEQLERLTAGGDPTSQRPFAASTWERDEGRHGGGRRLGVAETPIFNRASVNYSSVSYDDVPTSAVLSATALSVIIHPRNPHAPSMHCHFSYTEPRGKAPCWRMIADLNPSLHSPEAKNRFEQALSQACPPELFGAGKTFGDKYFFIPELNQYRGTCHLFLPEVTDAELLPEAARGLAQELARATVDAYVAIVQGQLDDHGEETVTERERAAQLAYHTLYFYQVLFLDCGTTAGLLAHAENDAGTLASLPSYIDAGLLRSWLRDGTVQPPHDVLLRRMLDVLPASDGPCHVSEEMRRMLAAIVREYYVEDRTRAKYQADMDLAGWAARRSGA